MRIGKADGEEEGLRGVFGVSFALRDGLRGVVAIVLVSFARIAVLTGSN